MARLFCTIFACAQKYNTRVGERRSGKSEVVLYEENVSTVLSLSINLRIKACAPRSCIFSDISASCLFEIYLGIVLRGAVEPRAKFPGQLFYNFRHGSEPFPVGV
jgi:hypothetical protein